MKTVFCIDDNPRYLRMLQVAVRSLRRMQGDDVPLLCVYAGDDACILEGLERERIPVARYRPQLTPERIPPQFHGCIGCFLKLELALLPELADDEYALYCDADMLFLRRINALHAQRPAYMSMAREHTAPFFHQHDALSYTWRDKDYVVPLPFPIWTFSSGVAVFHLARLRRHDLIHSFLAFCEQNVHRIGNLDQSLLNYYFGKRIQKLDGVWNRPPYHADALEKGHVIHFHGPKPWDVARPLWNELRICCFEPLRQVWASYLTPPEREEYEAWCAADRAQFAAK